MSVPKVDPNIKVGSSPSIGQQSAVQPQPATSAQQVLQQQPQPSKSLEELIGRLTDITKAISGKMESLSEDSQTPFDEAIAWLREIYANFQAQVIENIKSTSTGIEAQTKIKAEEAQYKEICQIWEGVKPLFVQREKILETSSRNNTIEAAYLTEALIGNDSLFAMSNFTRTRDAISNFSVPTLRFGANYRLYETQTALDVRMKRLGLTREDMPTEGIAGIADTIPNYDLRKTLGALLQDLACTKEQLTIYFEALCKGPANEAALNSDHPAKIYVHYKQELEGFSQRIKEAQSEQADRIFKIGQEIGTLNAPSDSSKLSLLKGEREELVKRFEFILKREGQITSLLKRFLVLLQLSEERLPKKESAEEIAYLGEVHRQAAETLNRAVAFKEDVVLENDWEAFAPVEQRKASYFQMVAEAQKLKELKDAADVKLKNRLPCLEEGVKTYQKYLETMRQGIELVEGNLNTYTTVYRIPEKKGGFLSGWWGSSEQPAPLTAVAAKEEEK